MSPSYKPVPVAPFLKGLNAATDVYTQPKGTFPRGSNLLLNKRGALDVCDGSLVLYEFSGALQSGRGKGMCNFLFAPTGVSRYYLSLFKALDIPLGPPKNLTASASGTGGTLATATYFYKVTANDGAGGETSVSNEVSQAVTLGQKVTLTWNIVPNAQSYNVYRSTTTNNELKIFSSALPVAQPAAGTLTQSFVDDGSAAIGVTAAVFEIQQIGQTQMVQISFVNPVASSFPVGSVVVLTGSSPSGWNGSYTVTQITSGLTLQATSVLTYPNTPSFTGTLSLNAISPPNSDNTQQTALFKMPVLAGPVASVPTSYSNANVVALYPADVNLPDLDGGGGGGSGGGGGGGAGGSSGGSGTASGGIQGNVSLIPQMLEFTNRVIIALGNGFPPQMFSDPSGTAVNPAAVVSISAISVDAFGVVSITTSAPHNISTNQVGANVLLAGVFNPLYNGAFPTIAVPSSTQLQVRNLGAIGQAASSGGTLTVSTVPLTSSFVPAFPNWSATTNYSTNSIVQPSPANNHYYKAIQGGTSGASQPSFPTGTGQQVADGGIIWQEAGATNTAAPAPPGAAHIVVYAGSLWAWNTSPTNTANGLDGPCSLRMSDVNNPLSWNPINQAFLDKDDGTEGMGIASFTITAQGIPPEGSLIPFKNYATYQIVGVFGSPNLVIQKTKSAMGCIAPRTIQFVPGFGLMRFTHLGIGVFDGVDDRVNSEELRPYLFPTNDFAESDITVLDSLWQAVMWGFQTANPPMYCFAAPIGNSNSALTRIFCYDMVLKAWTAPVDLPFSISTAAQFTTSTANPVTVFGGFSDGALSRWQASDQLWDSGATGVRTPSQVAWSIKLPEAVSQDASQKLNCRRLTIRGINTSALTTITVVPVVNGAQKPSQKYSIPSTGDFEVFSGFMRDGLRFSAIVSGNGQLELDRFSFHITPKSIGAKAVVS